MSHIDAISDKLDLEEKIQEYKNVIIINELKKMKLECPFYRKIRGDGNCFYRSNIYFYLQFLLIHENEFKVIKNKLENIIQYIKKKDFSKICTEQSLIDGNVIELAINVDKI